MEMKKQGANRKVRKERKQAFPKGWDEKRIGEVIAYYDKQTEDEEVAEYEAAMRVQGQSVMFVPTELVPEIRQLIRKRRGA
jgi:hypothetical protein